MLSGLLLWWRRQAGAVVDSRQGTRNQKESSSSPQLGDVEASTLVFGGQSIILGEKASFTIINSGESDSSQSTSYHRKRNIDSSDSDTTLKAPPNRRKHKRQKKAGRKSQTKRNSKNLCENLERQFKSFKDSDKWILPSGRCCEELLLQECVKLAEPAFNASFYPSLVIPINHGQTKPPIFSTEEWKAILESELELPKRRTNLLQPYRQVRSAADLQSVVDGGILPAPVMVSKGTMTPKEKEKEDTASTEKEDLLGSPKKTITSKAVEEETIKPTKRKKETLEPGDKSNGISDVTTKEELVLRRWVRSCFEQLLFLQSFNRLSETNPEGWLNIELWSHFLDKCILSIPEITLYRGETCSQATAERRNRQRESHHERQRIGRKLDGMFTLRGGNVLGLELGGIECSKFNAGARNTKCLKDSLKLARAMRDMMVMLQEHYPSIRRKLRIIGIICNGLTLRMFVMENPKGQICLFRALEPVHVPVDFNLRALAKIILQIAQIRDILAESVRDLLNCAAESLSQLTDEDERSGKVKDEHTTLMFSADTD